MVAREKCAIQIGAKQQSLKFFQWFFLPTAISVFNFLISLRHYADRSFDVPSCIRHFANLPRNQPPAGILIV